MDPWSAVGLGPRSGTGVSIEGNVVTLEPWRWVAAAGPVSSVSHRRLRLQYVSGSPRVLVAVATMPQPEEWVDETVGFIRGIYLSDASYYINGEFVDEDLDETWVDWSDTIGAADPGVVTATFDTSAGSAFASGGSLTISLRDVAIAAFGLDEREMHLHWLFLGGSRERAVFRLVDEGTLVKRLMRTRALLLGGRAGVADASAGLDVVRWTCSVAPMELSDNVLAQDDAVVRSEQTNILI